MSNAMVNDVSETGRGAKTCINALRVTPCGLIPGE